MARSTKTPPPPDEDFVERIVDIDVADEMQGSFLEYAYSVIYSRALPDARDGLKPVHRRILYRMAEMGLRPDRGHVKCARVVGDVMGKLHPHGDAAIYDALVRMAQPFSMRLPLVDGHGNFGSLGNDDPPAAFRYTECRLTPAAMLMTDEHRRGRRRLRPNYDDRELRARGPARGVPQPAGQRRDRHRRRHGDQHGAAQPGRGRLRRPPPDQAPGRDPRRPDAVRARAPTCRPAARSSGSTASARPTRPAAARSAPGPPRGSRTSPRAARASSSPSCRTASARSGSSRRSPSWCAAKKLQGITDVDDLTDREQGPAPGHRDQERLQPRGRARAALPAHADGGDVRHQQRRARRRASRARSGLKELLEVYVGHRLDVVRRRSAVPPQQGAGPAAPRRGPAGRDPRHRRGHPGDPRRATTPRRRASG